MLFCMKSNKAQFVIIYFDDEIVLNKFEKTFKEFLEAGLNLKDII